MDWTIDDITSTNVNSDLSITHEKWAKAGPIFKKQLLNPTLTDWNVPLIHSSTNTNKTHTDKIIERPANQTL